MNDISKRPDNQITALYERLSRDDDIHGDSNSIVNQKKMLEDYARQNGFTHLEHFTDDGYSGGNFERPGWKRMLEGIENGRIGTIILKDMSRAGRNYLEVGYFTEVYFRKKGVRFIAITNGVDSLNNESSEFAPFLNIMNEWYLRDCSRKIRAAWKAKGMEGKPVTNNPPYGYMKSPEDKDKWLVDEEAAEVVRRIFSMAAEGIGPHLIARRLSEEKIEKPSCYLAKRGRGIYKNRSDLTHPYVWNGTTISRMLGKPEYMGDTVNFRRYKVSYKEKKYRDNPKDKIAVFQDTHEAIIDRKTWYLVQELRKTVRRKNSDGEVNPLTGKVFCADCGAKMHYHKGYLRPGRNWKGIPDGTVRETKAYYNCSTYKYGLGRYGEERSCCSHMIHVDTLEAVILETIQYTVKDVRLNPDAFAEKMKDASELRSKNETRKLKQKMNRQEKRIKELDALVRRIYEDNIAGKLSDKRYEAMYEDYDREQTELEKLLEEEKERIATFEVTADRTEEFLELVRKYTKISELTPVIINEFLDRVIVHKAERVNGERMIEIEVYLNVTGKVELPVRELTKEELENRRRLNEKRERNRLRQQKHRAKFKEKVKELRAQKEGEEKEKMLSMARKAAEEMADNNDPSTAVVVVSGEFRTQVPADRFPTKQELLEKYGDLLVSNEGVEEFLRKSGEAESPISALSGGDFNDKINRK